MSATESIARWIATTSHGDIPPEARRAAKETYFDCLGLMVAGSVEPLGQIIQRYVLEQGGPPQATVLGGGHKTSVAHAALANATMGMAMDYDPEPQMMAIAAALLAVAEHTGASERDLMAAFVTGSELGWIIGTTAVTDLERRGLHHHGVLGAIAAAAASAKLLNLDQHQITMAMGMAGSMGGGLLQSEGTMTKPLLGGLIARDGVMAAELAGLDMSAGERLFENPSGFCGTNITDGIYDFTEPAASLGRPFRIQEFKYVRQYPCCRANHGALDSVLGLMRDEQFDALDVGRVEIDQSYRSIVIRYERPDNEHQARFSIRYVLAAALVDGELGIGQFTPERINAPEIREMMDKIHINVLTQWEVGAGDYMGAVPVKIHLRDARVLERTTEPDQILGGYKNPLGLDFMLSKFRQTAGLALDAAKVERAIETWSPEGEVANVAGAVQTLVAG